MNEFEHDFSILIEKILPIVKGRNVSFVFKNTNGSVELTMILHREHLGKSNHFIKCSRKFTLSTLTSEFEFLFVPLAEIIEIPGLIHTATVYFKNLCIMAENEIGRNYDPSVAPTFFAQEACRKNQNQ